jgi:hypothetical protein
MTKNTESASEVQELPKFSDRTLQQTLRTGSRLRQRFDELSDEISYVRNDYDFDLLLRDHKFYSIARKIRLRLWNEYDKTIKSGKNFMMASVYYGIISESSFYNKILKDDLLMTFIYTRPQEITSIQEDILYEGYKQLEQVMLMPIQNPDGSPNVRLIQYKLKIIQMMEDRVNGSVVQRTQTYVEQVSKFEGNDKNEKKQLEDLRKEVANMKKNLGKEVEDVEFTELKD